MGLSLVFGVTKIEDAEASIAFTLPKTMCERVKCLGKQAGQTFNHIKQNGYNVYHLL
jgi:hypothetical protein